MSAFRFSVFINTFNQKNLITSAIKSALDQDYPKNDYEIIIVDDGSSDGTSEICRSFLEKHPDRNIFYKKKENGGQASVFNLGIKICSGEFICFLDGDDFFYPNKLKVLDQFLTSRPDAEIVGNSFVENNSEYNLLINHVAEYQRKLKIKDMSETLKFLAYRIFFGTSRLTIKKSVAEEMLPVPKDLVVEADEYLFTLAALKYNCFVIPDLLTNYLIHGENLYMTDNGNHGAILKKVEILKSVSFYLEKLIVETIDDVDIFHVVNQHNLDQLQRMHFLDGIKFDPMKFFCSKHLSMRQRCAYLIGKRIYLFSIWVRNYFRLKNKVLNRVVKL